MKKIILTLRYTKKVYSSIVKVTNPCIFYTILATTFLKMLTKKGKFAGEMRFFKKFFFSKKIKNKNIFFKDFSPFFPKMLTKKGKRYGH